MRKTQLLLFSILFTFPLPALAKIGVSAGIGGIQATAIDVRGGTEVGANVSLDAWKAAVLSAGPDLRVATGFTVDDRYSYASAGLRLNVELLVLLSAAVRVGGAHFDGLLVPVKHEAGTPRELLAPVIESELMAGLPVGPLLAGLRLGHGRILIPRGPNFEWDSLSLVLGLRL